MTKYNMSTVYSSHHCQIYIIARSTDKWLRRDWSRWSLAHSIKLKVDVDDVNAFNNKHITHWYMFTCRLFPKTPIRIARLRRVKINNFRQLIPELKNLPFTSADSKCFLLKLMRAKGNWECSHLISNSMEQHITIATILNNLRWQYRFSKNIKKLNKRK